MILEGKNAVLKNRKIMGATDPKKIQIQLDRNMEFQSIKILYTDPTR